MDEANVKPQPTQRGDNHDSTVDLHNSKPSRLGHSEIRVSWLNINRVNEVNRSIITYVVLSLYTAIKLHHLVLVTLNHFSDCLKLCFQ